MRDPHQVLGVPVDADEDAIRAAYRAQLKEHHPDHGGSTERFLRLKEAYEALLSGDAGGLGPRGGGTVAGHAGGSGAGAVRASRPVEGRDGPELVAAAGGLTVRLVALTDGDCAEDLLPDHVDRGRRVVACFRVENGRLEPVTWRARRVRFVDGAGERHLPSVYRPKGEGLPDPWRGDDVDVPPGETVHSFLLSRTLPEDEPVSAVVYDGAPAESRGSRVRFELDAAARQVLDRNPLATV